MARNNIVSVRVTDDELAELHLWMRSLDLTMNDVLYQLIFNRTKEKA